MRRKDRIQQVYNQAISGLISGKAKTGEVDQYLFGRATALLYVLDDELTLAEAEGIIANQVDDAAAGVTG